MDIKKTDLAQIPKNKTNKGVWPHSTGKAALLLMDNESKELRLYVNDNDFPIYGSMQNFSWSYDGKHFAYVLFVNDRCQLYIDNELVKELESYSYQSLIWSKSGNLTYAFQKNNEVFVAFGEQEFGPYCSNLIETGSIATPFSFSKDGEKVSYIAEIKEDAFACIVNGEVVSESFDYAKGKSIFSQSGTEWAFIAEDTQSDKYKVISSNGDSELFDKINKLYFTDDGSELAYLAETESQTHLVINNKIVKSASKNKLHHLSYTSTFDGFSYVEENKSKKQLCISRLNREVFVSAVYTSAMFAITFSNSSKQVGYLVKQGKQGICAMVNDTLVAEDLNTSWDKIDSEIVMVSTSGTEMAYMIPIKRKKKYSIAINNETGFPFDGIYGDYHQGTLFSNREGEVEFCAIEENVLYWVKQSS